MTTSHYFSDLRALYQAELDDLRTDSEGNNVLARHLDEKRGELGFLMQMMDANPEMLAVVFHQALPGWDAIGEVVDVAAWACDMVRTITATPMGGEFMVTAAALEYLYHKPFTLAERAGADDGEDEDGQDQDEVRAERHDDNHTDDHDHDDTEAAARAREEAGNDWMAEQGFDRKDTP